MFVQRLQAMYRDGGLSADKINALKEIYFPFEDDSARERQLQGIGVMVRYMKEKFLGTTDALGNTLVPGLGFVRGNSAISYLAPPGASEAETKLGEQTKSFINELR